MKIWPILLIVSTLVGCSFIRVESGVGTAGPISSITPGHHADEIFSPNIGLGQIFSLTDGLSHDIIVQTNSVFANHQPEGFGIQTIQRLRLKTGKFEPYVGGHFGLIYTLNKWRGQATHGNFTLGGILGTRYRINDHLWVTGEYRLFHLSNGSKVVGSKQPNEGWNNDCIFLGLEFEW